LGSESWVLRRDTFHTTLEDAKEYIRMKSRVFTDLSLFLADLKSDDEKKSMVEEFCFSDKYIKYQRFFLIRTPSDIKTVQDKIIKSIESDGVRVFKS